ncbi:hypothetical protein ACFPM1_12265 [Halorubrum rubrum]|uniref:Uncharacterized protein n=1 Tax=Halorubrum rubrum TaxID=1126240 RepID=A0ABD5R3T3_9EURY|nr:hypothetical protein [Halorubrum rubrum]
MSREPSREDPVKGDEYVLPDGSTEIVFLVEDGRVLTVSEYESVDAFEESVSTGRYAGSREEVATMPDVEAFADPDPATDDSEN